MGFYVFINCVVMLLCELLVSGFLDFYIQTKVIGYWEIYPYER